MISCNIIACYDTIMTFITIKNFSYPYFSSAYSERYFDGDTPYCLLNT